MTVVFDTPVFTIILQDLFGTGEIWCFTRDTVCDHPSFFTVFFVLTDMFDHECLTNIGKLQVFIEFGGQPDVSGFNASMIWTVIGGMVRFPVYIFEIKGDILKEALFVALGSKVNGPVFA